MSKFRTHRCDEIRLSDVDKKVIISGFVETIRDVIAFPMTSKAEDLLMKAPGAVTREQLRELKIKIDIKES